jgi:hypothetical protein
VPAADAVTRDDRATADSGAASARSAWPEAVDLAERLVADAGKSVRAVLLYGSRLHKTNPDRHSALDFVVLVDDYRSFYSALSSADELHRPVSLMAGLARMLPPNVIAYTPDEGRDGLAKCLIVTKADFKRALGPDPRDHFILGRMLQRVGEVWFANAEEGDWVRSQIRGAHMRVLEWLSPYLDEPVNAAGLGRRLLEVCYQGELRPESRSRSDAIFEAQADHFVAALQPALAVAVSAGTMVEQDGLYRLASPLSPATGRRWRRHFRRSKLRSTSRWFKHMLTFANWLPYVTRKVERHTGRTIELTTLEKKLPLIFLWPRAIHVLLTRPRREIRS